MAIKNSNLDRVLLPALVTLWVEIRKSSVLLFEEGTSARIHRTVAQVMGFADGPGRGVRDGPFLCPLLPGSVPFPRRKHTLQFLSPRLRHRYFTYPALRSWMLWILKQGILRTRHLIPPAYEELIEVVTRAVAKLNIDWQAEKQEVQHKIKLDERFLSSRSQPPRRGLSFFPDFHTWNRPVSYCVQLPNN